MLKLPELFRNSKKKHDPEKVNAFHEACHGMVQVYFGVLPKFTSILGYNHTKGFNTEGFYAYWELV
jgi:hypothetical protein